MAKHLATFTDTLNDIEIIGFIVMTDKEIENYEDLATSITWDFTYQIGSEELSFSSGEDLLSRIDFREISNEEAKSIKRLFKEGFGIFVTEDYLEGIVSDDEFSEIDEDDEDDFNEDDDDDY